MQGHGLEGGRGHAGRQQHGDVGRHQVVVLELHDDEARHGGQVGGHPDDDEAAHHPGAGLLEGEGPADGAVALPGDGRQGQNGHHHHDHLQRHSA